MGVTAGYDGPGGGEEGPHLHLVPDKVARLPARFIASLNLFMW